VLRYVYVTYLLVRRQVVTVEVGSDVVNGESIKSDRLSMYNEHCALGVIPAG